MATTEPDLELQGAIINRLKADPAVTALVGTRIFDSVPASALFPYISYGPSDALQTDADCINGIDIDVQIDVWSRSPGFPEAKKINGAVRNALHDVDLVLATNGLVFLEHRQTSTRRDPDGLTSHGIVQLNAFIEVPTS